MMNPSIKRIAFILLVLVGIGAIAATIYFLFLNKTLPVAPVQPVATTPTPLDTNTLVKPQPAAKPVEQVTPPAPDSAAEMERKAREALFRRARDLASRFGSYGNADDYASLLNLFPDVTPEVQTYLLQERVTLRAAHPARTTSFAQTTRALAARLTTDVAVVSATEVEVMVDAQQRIEDGTTETTVIRQGVLKLVKSGADWQVARITWQEPNR